MWCGVCVWCVCVCGGGSRTFASFRVVHGGARAAVLQTPPVQQASSASARDRALPLPHPDGVRTKKVGVSVNE